MFYVSQSPSLQSPIWHCSNGCYWCIGGLVKFCKGKMSMRPRSPYSWTISCSGNIIEVSLPQLWQVCVGTLPSSTPFSEFRILRAPSAGPHLQQFLLCVLYQFLFLNHQLSKSFHPATYCRSKFERAMVWISRFPMRSSWGKHERVPH